MFVSSSNEQRITKSQEGLGWRGPRSPPSVGEVLQPLAILLASSGLPIHPCPWYRSVVFLQDWSYFHTQTRSVLISISPWSDMASFSSWNTQFLHVLGSKWSLWGDSHNSKRACRQLYSRFGQQAFVWAQKWLTVEVPVLTFEVPILPFLLASRQQRCPFSKYCFQQVLSPFHCCSPICKLTLSHKLPYLE